MQFTPLLTKRGIEQLQKSYAMGRPVPCPPILIELPDVMAAVIKLAEIQVMTDGLIHAFGSYLKLSQFAAYDCGIPWEEIAGPKTEEVIKTVAIRMGKIRGRYVGK